MYSMWLIISIHLYTKAVQVIYLVLYLTRGGLFTSDHRLRGHGHGGRGGVCVLGRGRGWAGWLLLFVRVCLGNVVHHADLCFSVGSPLCLQRQEQSGGRSGDLSWCFLHRRTQLKRTVLRLLQVKPKVTAS